ncbi:MAG: hypothetical protein JNM43_08330 [Planctomycetaceae bacterium]|nr:hypothetical protein [Planctomycetaceae bacterium]
MKWLGLAAISFCLFHVAYHWKFGNTQNALWACHVASVLVGLGLLVQVPTISAIGLLWLVLGIPLWILSLVGGGEFIPTSILTHFGGAAIGVIAFRQHKWPSGVWWMAFVSLAAWFVVTRQWTAPELNVNLAFQVPGRKMASLVSHRTYLTILSAGIILLFWTADRYFSYALTPVERLPPQ